MKVKIIMGKIGLAVLLANIGVMLSISVGLGLGIIYNVNLAIISILIGAVGSSIAVWRNLSK